jgi:hypothetical protein
MSPYFDSAYFDPAYFDTDSGSTPPAYGSGRRWRRRYLPPEERPGDDEFFVMLT